MLWNIDLTLVDVAQVTRAAYAEAFREVTGRPLVQLAPMAGKSESEIFFESLALNGADPGDGDGADELLPAFTEALETAFRSRRPMLTQQGRLLPGARESVTAVAAMRGTVQTVLTGTIRPNAIEKLRAFGLERYFDFDVGGYGSEIYPKGTRLLQARSRATEKYRVEFGEGTSVYIADSARDVEAARIGGAQMIAVASGRATMSELREARADRVLADLTQTGAVVHAIEQLTTPAGAGADRRPA